MLLYNKGYRSLSTSSNLPVRDLSVQNVLTALSQSLGPITFRFDLRTLLSEFFSKKGSVTNEPVDTIIRSNRPVKVREEDYLGVAVEMVRIWHYEFALIAR